MRLAAIPAVVLFAALSAAGVVPAGVAAPAAAAAGCPVVAAHKGLHWPYSPDPENSLAAIGDAARHGARWIETDVAMSRDGWPVIVHTGADFAFVTGRPGQPGGYTYAQLLAMRLRTHPGAPFTGQRIPSVAAYLATARAWRLHVEIEVETWWTAAEFGRYMRILKAAGLAGFGDVSGVTPGILAAVRRAYPGLRTHLLAASYWHAPPTAQGSVMEDLEVSYATPARAAALAAQRTALDIWTPDTTAAMRKALALHPAMVTTDDLGLFRRLSGC